MRNAEEIEVAMREHGNAVYRLCCLYFRDRADAEDAYQETFLRFAQADAVTFADGEHRKAWLLRVGANVCKDMLKAASRKNTALDVNDAYESVDPWIAPGSELSMVLDAINRLDDPPRTPLYLSLYEGYTASAISQMMDAPENTVYSWISRGKKMLREALS